MKSLSFFNSDGRSIQEFIPLVKNNVGMYCCGPTVYNYAHIGNLRPYTHWDILRRVFERFGYTVKHVMNITDVGHLTDDGDDGEDKMIKGARERGMSVWDIAEYFTKAFFEDIKRLNIQMPHISCKATDHIDDMIALVERLEKNGLTYQSNGNIYFDTAQFGKYGKMALIERQNLIHGTRVDIDPSKKNQNDFVLWFTNSKFINQAMIWDSPWGRGYPGWHLECSAMSSKYLGESFDIHTGGIDHISVHHTNEIAQSEGAFGKKWVNYWLHNEFLIIKGGKMAKSKGEMLTLQNLIDDGYDALDYRYFLLGGHYRSQLIFSPDSLKAARSAHKSLQARSTALLRTSRPCPFDQLSRETQSLLDEFDQALCDDMNTPRALAAMWRLVKDEKIAAAEKLTAMFSMDEILGLDLKYVAEKNDHSPVDEHIRNLLEQRNKVRAAKVWAESDRLRDEIQSHGWKVVDSPDGTRLEKP